MASIEFHLRESLFHEEHVGSLFVRIIHKRRIRSVTIPYKLYKHEWDKKRHCVVLSSADPSRIQYLKKVITGMEEERSRLLSIMDNLEEKGDFSISEIVEYYKNRKGGCLLKAMTQEIVKELTMYGQERTARAYLTVVNGFLSFVGNENLSVEQVNSVLLKRFERSMRDRGKSMNTISFYMRNLRSIYNRIYRDYMFIRPKANPFERVYTGVQHTRKRALNKEEMILLSQWDKKISFLNKSTGAGKQAISQDPTYAGYAECMRLFLFSFYARGMSFVDMAFLKKGDIRGDTISYYRRKTGQLLEVKLTTPMLQIIRSFSSVTKKSPYVFPIIKCSGKSERLQYESYLRLQNKRLKKIAGCCGLKKTLSTHVARHTWATIAKNEKLPLSVISESLGHTSEKTTAIYLASFDRKTLDQANDKVTKAIKKVS
ncbi:site-specific integrase [Parabacteroides sp. OttesenSCG-928-K15]|nr:site-specific integrase [Parabacteroides sp. OttesenSCG-928-K15]